jgi:hypothetical protein
MLTSVVIEWGLIIRDHYAVTYPNTDTHCSYYYAKQRYGNQLSFSSILSRWKSIEVELRNGNRLTPLIGNDLIKG